MYRQWSNLKLSASIYRYHIAAGAATYFAAPHFFTFLHVKRTYIDAQIQERRQMEQKGLLNY